MNSLNEKYARISSNVDFSVMSQISLFVVGVGASGNMVESLVRIGLRNLWIYDPDVVSESNLTCQNFLRSDVGLPKPEALRRRLEGVAPELDNPVFPPLRITTGGDFLALSDEDLAVVFERERQAGRIPVLLMVTDRHPVQARGNRLALLHGIPALWIGMYRGGRAGEIVVYSPDAPVACPCYRCAVHDRFDWWDKTHRAQFLAGHKLHAGVSGGLPHATMVVDGIASHLLVGAMHHAVPSAREVNPHAKLWGRVIAEGRTLVQVQLDPMYRLDGEDLFADIQGENVITFVSRFEQTMVRSKVGCDCTKSAETNQFLWTKTNLLEDATPTCREVAHG